MMQAALQAGQPPAPLKRPAISSGMDDLQRKKAVGCLKALWCAVRRDSKISPQAWLIQVL
jgi:hypothetical protein